LITRLMSLITFLGFTNCDVRVAPGHFEIGV
jgi:hypothetical protein